MNVLIVVESCFSNTHRLAEAVASGLTDRRAQVNVVEAAAEHFDLEGVDLLVLGAPIHHRGLPNRLSRALAATQGASPKPFGVAEWLDAMPQWEQGRAAAFDSATGRGFINGSAVNPMAKRLQRRGVELVAAERFLVEVMEGPVVSADLVRAREWGTTLASLGGKTGETAAFWLPSSPEPSSPATRSPR